MGYWSPGKACINITSGGGKEGKGGEGGREGGEKIASEISKAFWHTKENTII